MRPDGLQMNDNPLAEKPRQAAYLGISDAIDRIDSTVHALARVLHDIRGNEVCAEKDNSVRNVPTLAEFLETGQMRIDEKTERMHDLISELRRVIL